MSTAHSSRYVFMISFVAAAGGFLFGYDLGVIVGANPILKEQFNLSDTELGFATASAVIGCILGPFLGSYLADAIGRKNTMLIACFLLGVSALFTAIPDNMTTYNIFRIVGGVGVGLCSMASPMYIAEVAPREKRGQLGIMYQLAIVIGHTVSPMVGAALAANLADDISWRWMFASEAVAVLAFACLIFTIPNSPRWLASKGRKDEARAVLTRVGGADYADSEMEVIESALSEKKVSIVEVLAPGLRYALVIGLLLALFNNWTGWSVIGGYVAILLERAELGARWLSILQAGFAYFMMGIMALTSLLVVDRIGRKPLWNLASLAMAFITLLAGFMFHFEWTGIIVLIIVGLCTIPHGLALGPLPWLMMSELFPTRLRAKAVAITTTFLWIVIFLGAQLFPPLCYFSEKLLASGENTAALETTTVSFADDNMDSITDENADFVTLGLVPGSKINISGSQKSENNLEATVHLVLENEIILAGGHNLRNQKAGDQITIASVDGKTYSSSTVTFVDGNLDAIVDPGAQFIEKGFQPGWRKATVIGATESNNNATFDVRHVSAGFLLVAASALKSEPAGASIRIQNGSLAGTFWLFTIICFLSLLFGKFMLPETKGRTLEEIAASWKKK